MKHADAKPLYDTDTLASLIDTLLPSEDLVAGAIDLDLDKRFIKELNKDQTWAKIINHILHSINERALNDHSKPFSKLGVNERESMLNHILYKKGSKKFRSYLKRFRKLIITWYYQSDDGHQSIGYLLPANYPAAKHLPTTSPGKTNQ